jgi:hypothetical protein
VSAERFKNKAPFGIGSADLWWDVQAPEQLGIFQSTLELSDQFYREVMEHPIPVDMRVLKLLKRSPMALDVYAWLSYRMFTLSRGLIGIRVKSCHKDFKAPFDGLL